MSKNHSLWFPMFSVNLLVKNVMDCMIRKDLSSQKALMIELTLLTLLNYVGDNFCEYRNLGHDNYKSLLLSYSDASNKYGALEVKKVIEKSENFKVTAVAIAAIKCPQHIVCLLYTSPSPRDFVRSRMPSSA